MFITFRSRFPFLKSEWSDEEGNSSLWVRTSHESCDRPAFRWIKSWKRLESDIPGTTLSRKSRRGRSRERRRTSFVRESWRITRNREPFHSCFFFFFPLSLSLHRATLCATLPLLSALGSNLVLHRNATSWTWLVFKEAGGIHQTGPPGFHRASESFSSQLGSFRFLLLGKDLARSCSVLRERWSFLRSKKGFKFVVFGKKTTIITKLIANRWIERLARIIRSSPLPSIELPSMFICSTSAFDGSLLFPFSFFFFYEFLLWRVFQSSRSGMRYPKFAWTFFVRVQRGEGECMYTHTRAVVEFSLRRFRSE